MRLNNYTVPNMEIKIAIEMEFKAQDTDTQTSSTDAAHQGIKGKVVTVSLLIRFEDQKDLTELTAIAQAVRADGSLEIYNIVETAANAMNIRQVRFTEKFTVTENSTFQAWDIKFSLKEYKSVPENTEARNKPEVTQAQSAQNNATAVDDAPKPGNSSWLEKTLSSLDNMLK